MDDDGIVANNEHGSTWELTNQGSISIWSVATGHHALVQLAAFMATRVSDRFKRPITGSAGRYHLGTVDHKLMTSRHLVVPQPYKAFAVNNARATALQNHWPASRLQGLPYFALLTSTSCRRPNLGDARQRRCLVAPFRCLWRQQRALVAANYRFEAVPSRRR